MARKRRPPSRARYDDANPTIGVHVDFDTYQRLVKLREESGTSFGYLVRRALGVVEEELERAIARGFAKGQKAGTAEAMKVGMSEGRTAGYREGWDAGHKEGHAGGRAEGYIAGTAQAERTYKLEYTCCVCGQAVAIKQGEADAAWAIRQIDSRGWGHDDCVDRESRRRRLLQ